MGGVLRGGELVPDTGLLQGQTQTGQGPLQVHTQGQLVVEQAPRHNLGARFHTEERKMGKRLSNVEQECPTL